MHVMMDLETLATSPDAAVFQIGAVAFELRSGGKVYNGAKAFNQWVSARSCQSIGMAVDPRTVAWWMDQVPDARIPAAKGMTEGVHIAEALNALEVWPLETFEVSWAAVEGVWAHPSVFDVPILSLAWSRFGQKPPWDRRRVYDTRTVYLLAGGQPEVESIGVSHDAVNDCERQICQLQKAMAVLGNK